MKKTLNGDQLKLIAILAMTVDHVTDLIYPGFPAVPAAILLHIIGRLTAPIMWFFISEGFHYTHDIKKYLLRLGGFAVISHFAYCFAFGIDLVPFRSGIFNQTSVMYPLFVGALVLWLQNSGVRMREWQRTAAVFLLIWSAFPGDWSCIAVLSVVGMYRNRGNLKKQMTAILPWVLLYAAVSFFFVDRAYGLVQPFVFLVYPLLKRYNGQRGKRKGMKWFFYLYYPAHLAVIGLLRILLYGNVPILF